MCGRGPNMVVYPEGVWYSGVQPADVEEIVREHFGSGRVVERLRSGDPAAIRQEIDENRKKMLAGFGRRLHPSISKHREQCPGEERHPERPGRRS